MNEKILALVSQGEQSHIAVILAQRSLDRLQLEMEAARSALTVAQTHYDELAVSVTGETNLPRPAFDDMIQKRVGALIELGLVGGDIDFTTATIPSVQPAVLTAESPTQTSISSTPAPNNPYGDDQPRSRSAYQKGYDDGIAGQAKDINLYKRPSAQTAYAQGYDAGARDKDAGGAEETIAPQILADETAGNLGSDVAALSNETETVGDAGADTQEQARSSQSDEISAPAAHTAVSPGAESSADSSGDARGQDADIVSFSPDGIFMTKAREEGAQAALASEPKSTCPYAPGPLRQSWEEGYDGAVDQRLQEMASPEAELNSGNTGSVIVLDPGASLTATQFAQSDQPDESIFDVGGPYGDEVGMADEVTIVSADNLDIPPFLRRGAEVH
ncbi:ribosome modulation factor [Microvirga calopogonii]|uniref:ribosome modulation factor n=1 Tax=Microvirga calopogonii TaxID=2078013 RepID=UPI000E0D0F4E|nr:Rmf/CrpP family protein [Microvirga calopogonii]